MTLPRHGHITSRPSPVYWLHAYDDQTLKEMTREREGWCVTSDNIMAMVFRYGVCFYRSGEARTHENKAAGDS